MVSFFSFEICSSTYSFFEYSDKSTWAAVCPINSHFPFPEISVIHIYSLYVSFSLESDFTNHKSPALFSDSGRCSKLSAVPFIVIIFPSDCTADSISEMVSDFVK